MDPREKTEGQETEQVVETTTAAPDGTEEQLQELVQDDAARTDESAEGEGEEQE